MIASAASPVSGEPFVLRVIVDSADVAAQSSDQAPKASITVESASNGTQLFSRTVSIPADERFEIDAMETVLVSLRSDALWALPTTATPDGESRIVEVQLEAEPAAVIGATFRMPPRTEGPEKLVAAFYLDDPEATRNPQLIREACPIDVRSSAYRCVVPARVQDFRLAPQSFVSHFFWGIQLEAGRTTRLGTLNLEKGGSLVGRVATWDGSEVPKDIKIQVQPEGLAEVRGASGRHAMISEARLMPKGFFQFPGLAQGTYLLTARAAPFAPESVHGIEILDGLEANLFAPVMLRPRAQLEIVVIPPVDPDGQPWVVQVGSRADYRNIEPVATDGSGTAVVPDLLYGRYLVKVLTLQGDQLWYDMVSIENPIEYVSARLEVVQTRGTLYLGDEPLQASLRFGGETGAQRATLKSDEAGLFSGLLPRIGRWSVDIESIQPDLRKRAVIDVPKPRDGISTLEIVLPDTELSGKVVTENGTPPVADTRVVAIPMSREEDQTTVDTEPDGGFRFRGLAEGPVRISAVSQLDSEGASEETTVNLSADAVDDVRLTLRPLKLFTGIVTAQGRPLPGAEVRIEAGDGLLRTHALDRTDAKGLWALHAPRSTNRLYVWVLPPGWGMYTTTHLADPELTEEMLNYEVGLPSGRFAVRFPPPPSTGVVRSEVMVRHAGAVIYPLFLRYWERMNEPSLPPKSEPALLSSGPVYPGQYDVCLVEIGTSEWLRFQISPGWLSPDCERIEVPSFGDVEITLE